MAAVCTSGKSGLQVWAQQIWEIEILPFTSCFCTTLHNPALSNNSDRKLITMLSATFLSLKAISSADGSKCSNDGQLNQCKESTLICCLDIHSVSCCKHLNSFLLEEKMSSLFFLKYKNYNRAINW